MINEDFLQDVISDYGVKTAILFCEIESTKYNRMVNEIVFTDPIDQQELQYERDWWADRSITLTNNSL